MIRIEFPATDIKAARIFADALDRYASPAAVRPEPDDKPAPAGELIGRFTLDQDGEIVLDDPDENSEPPRVSGAPSVFADSTPDEATPTPSAPGDKRVDPNGVPFNPEFCAEAKVPFYASGQHKGRWKKRKGVSEDEYTGWYVTTLSSLLENPEHLASTRPRGDGPVDTAGAFSNAATEAAPAGAGIEFTANNAEALRSAPQTCGDFMGWVSNQQVAGILTQDDIAAAYTAAGVGVTDLFPPNDDQTVAGHIAKLYHHLGGV